MNPRDQEWRTALDRNNGLLDGKLTDDITEIHIQGKEPYLYIQVEASQHDGHESGCGFYYAYPPLTMVAELMRLHGWTVIPPKEPA